MKTYTHSKPTHILTIYSNDLCKVYSIHVCVHVHACTDTYMKVYNYQFLCVIYVFFSLCTYAIYQYQYFHKKIPIYVIYVHYVRYIMYIAHVLHISYHKWIIYECVLHVQYNHIYGMYMNAKYLTCIAYTS